MNRKQLLAGAGLCAAIVWAVFAAGGLRLSSDAAGTTSQTVGNALAAQPFAAGDAGQPADAGSAVQPQPQAAQHNLAAQPAATTPPTAVSATATTVAGTAEAGEAAETPEADEAAETPEAAEAAETPEAAEAMEAPEAAGATETPEAGEAADQGGDEIEPGGTDNENDTETEDNGAVDTPAPAAQARITQQQAEQTVLAAHRGTTVAKTELDEEDGTVIYKVKLSDDTKVKVNAVTGAILSTDTPESDESDH